MKEDFDQIAKFEKAIEKKYGPSAVINPKSKWTIEKERNYLKDLKEFYRPSEGEETEKVRFGDVLISPLLLETESKNTCNVCDTYSLARFDDVYMNKYECCMKCYYDYVDGREARWASGWRPEKKDLNTKTV